MKLSMTIVSGVYRTVNILKNNSIKRKYSPWKKKKDCHYLNDIDFFSAIIPDLKLLIIPFYIFCNAHSAHLFQNTKEEAGIWKISIVFKLDPLRSIFKRLHSLLTPLGVIKSKIQSMLFLNI